MNRLAPLVAGLVVLVAVAADANALDVHGVDLKLGLRGGPNMVFLPTPVDVDEDDFVNPQGLFWGAGWNLGLALQVRAVDIVGLELGWMRAVEHGEATIELEEISDCSTGDGTRCEIQEVGAAIDFTAHHIPIALHLTLPKGTARPFATVGVDLVVRRNHREFSRHAIDPLPDDLDPETDADLLSQWDESTEGRYYLNATLRDEHPEFVAGILVGAGLNIVVEQIEIPVEFRLNIYPVTGDELDERGDFPPEGSTAYDPSFTVRYNDTWNYQLFVLFGLDYVIL